MDKGVRLRALRKSRALTLEKAGKLIGVSKQTLQRYELGIIKNIPPGKIEDLARIYGTSPAYIMGWPDGNLPDFTDPMLAFRYVLEQPAVAKYCGYDLEDTDDAAFSEMISDLMIAVKISSERRKVKRNK